MNKRLLNFASFAYENFAPLIVFVVAEHVIGFRGALIVTLIVSCTDLVLRLALKHAPTRLYYLSFFTTLLFGAIDLTMTNPFLFKYESVMTNLLTAAFFAATLFRGTPLIQEVAQKTMPPEKASRRDVQEYLRVLTGIWAGYFILKAGVYFYFATHYSLTEAMALRSAVGTLSLVGLLLGERLVRKPLYSFLARNKWIQGSPELTP